MAVVLIYTATIMPYSMAFVESTMWDSWFIFDLMVNMIFILDILINLTCAYTDSEGVLVTSRLKIIARYLRS